MRKREGTGGPDSLPCCITSPSRPWIGRFIGSSGEAAPGVDGETVTSYEQGLAAKLGALHARVQTGRYRPHPVRRVYIPKADGGRLGIPALEDKIVQSAVAEVLSALYEADFLGFSYGFRPGRSPHRALTALHTTLMTQCVNWELDADIRRFFDSVDHEQLLRVLADRVADPRILRLVRRWLRAGVLEGTEWHQTEQGTPQGAGISPLLANIFLHSVLDRWLHDWRQRNPRGRISVVRYADDLIMGCQCVLRPPEQLNWHRLDSFYDAIRWCWYRVLRRRSQRSLTWAGFTALEVRSPCLSLGSLTRCLPWRPALGHPEDEPSAGNPHARICEGDSRMAELLDHGHSRRPPSVSYSRLKVRFLHGSPGWTQPVAEW
jgi:hypothetical protein